MGVANGHVTVVGVAKSCDILVGVAKVYGQAYVHKMIVLKACKWDLIHHDITAETERGLIPE